MNPMHRRQLRMLWVYLLISLPMVVLEAVHATRPSPNSPLHWIPPTDSARSRFDQFSKLFGSSDVVVASWPGCTVDSPALEDLVASLEHDPEFSSSAESLFDHVFSGRHVLSDLCAVGYSRKEAIAKLRRTLIGEDGLSTCLVIGFRPAAVMRRAELVPMIQDKIRDVCGIDPVDQHLAGPIIDGLSVDTASDATLKKLAPTSTLIVLLTAIFCLRSWREALIVFIVSGYCQIATLALMSLCGDSMSALLVVLPPLIQVLALAAGLHIVNYFRESRKHISSDQAAWQAVKIGWLPCVLSAATTAIGMASLMVSELTPIRSFGSYAAAGILFTTAAVLIAVPACLSTLRRTSNSHSWNADRPWLHLIGLLRSHHIMIVVSLISVMMAAGLGLKSLRTSVRIETLFPPHSRILQDYRWIEEHVAPLVPIEVAVKFDHNEVARIDYQRRIVAFLEQRLAAHDEIEGTLSAATFFPRFDSQRSRPSASPATTPRHWLEAALSRLQDNHWLVTTDSDNVWRIRGFVSASKDLDYAQLLRQVEDTCRHSLTDKQNRPLRGVSVMTTGIMPLVHQIQHQLLDDLKYSFMMAFALILILMTILQGGFLSGCLAMIPNLFPTFLLFGTMGWLEIPVDIGSVMTASVALGVAVDDTLHFLTAFQRELALGRSHVDSVAHAYRHCGVAMVQTTVICAFGMSAFVVSDFVPTCRFAWMMIGLLGLALVGDLVLLPAVLISRVGRFVYPSTPIADTSTRTGLDNQESSAASMVKPGPNPSKTQGPRDLGHIFSSTNAIVGDDILP